MMYKVAWVSRFARSRPTIDAYNHWRGRHTSLIAGLPGVARIVQNRATEALDFVEASRQPPSFDVYTCVWFTDRDAFVDAMASPAWKALVEDSTTLYETGSMFGMSAAVEEHVIIDGPTGPVKSVYIVRFKQSIRTDEQRRRDAHSRWTDTHGGVYGAKVPGIGRYVQNHVIDTIDASGLGTLSPAEVGLDGFSECWFPDKAGFDDMNSSSEWDAMNKDADVLFDLSWGVPAFCALVEEIVVDVSSIAETV